MTKYYKCGGRDRMSKEVFKIEGQKLGLTSRELKNAINNVEKLTNKVAKKFEVFGNELLEKGLNQIIEMWKNNPDHVLSYKKNFKHGKRVMNRRRY